MYSQSSFITLKNDKLLSSLTWQLINPLLFNGPCLHQFEFILLDFCWIMLAVQKKSRRVREEFPISFLRMKWLTVTLFLNKQRKENICFCCFFFFLFRKHFTFLFFPLVYLLNHKSQSVREFQGNCKELATPIVMIPQSDKLTLQ